MIDLWPCIPNFRVLLPALIYKCTAHKWQICLLNLICRFYASWFSKVLRCNCHQRFGRGCHQLCNGNEERISAEASEVPGKPSCFRRSWSGERHAKQHPVHRGMHQGLQRWELAFLKWKCSTRSSYYIDCVDASVNMIWRSFVALCIDVQQWCNVN